MATFSSIKAKIKTVLEGISSIAFVYDYHNAQLQGYPAVTFDVSDNRGEFITNRENLRQISYTIVIYQEVAVKGLDAASKILDNVADDIVTTLESQANLTLGGEVNWTLPLAGPRGQFQSPVGVILFQELTLQCRFAYAT